MKAVIFLADGFEEIEALAPADIWRRLGWQVVLAGITGKTVTGAHGVRVEADREFSPAMRAEEFDVVYLPGGLPGATNLRDDPEVICFVQNAYRAGKIAAAICAAPIVLARSGLAAGHKVTGYPGTETMAEGLTYTGARTEADGKILTGIGPGAAAELALRIAKTADPTAETEKLASGMFLK